LLIIIGAIIKIINLISYNILKTKITLFVSVLL
jgi:hypothetical protein